MQQILFAVTSILQMLLLQNDSPSAVKHNSILTKVPEIDEELSKVVIHMI